MYLLAEILPIVRRFRIPFSRDQWMLLMAAINEIFLGIDTYLAHSISGTIRPYEWIPILFGPTAGGLLLLAGWIALRKRQFANMLASLVFLASSLVGLLGTYFHLNRALLLDAPAGQQVTASILVWAPPLLGPLTFILVAILGISAAWEEYPVGSGQLRLFGNLRVQMPLSKTRAYFFLVAFFTLATLASSVLDHARDHFSNPWLWAPTVIGVFTLLVATAMGAFERVEHTDLWTYGVAMVLMGGVGLLGAYLHVEHNLSGQGVFLTERFLRGAPSLAPLLFANMGALGIIVLLNPSPQPK